MSRKTGKPSYLRQAEQARSRRMRVAATIASVVVAALLGGLVGFLVGRPDATTRAVDALRAEEAKRDLRQIEDLTALARQSQAALDPLLVEFDAALDGSQPATESKIRGWQAALGQIAEKHADSPSGSTATNVARGGLRDSVSDFVIAVDLFATAQQASAGQRGALLEIVKRTRTAAATAWSVAATQLDQINVSAGLGHQHVYLQTKQGSDAFTSDGSPEGAGG
ncbi:hypothetical protein I0C86_22370 [Plantactinospora sp. S1510]|uniref:Uncharacterized protein n=1 Tax=Plantactinospora alkalitolerans TaxID=2789879 RepID=A0ABS0GZP9_9ACTN|nr:hypothetical protein [Plantactinospora alkalitolerans]MBF9131690.1 hypothetical protein [Plantactinospora alkalitolerans]